MEGKLIPNFHYVLIKDDYSDLEDRLDYYVENTSEAEQIVINANKYINQFKNNKTEDWLQLKILQKYFDLSDQRY